MNDAHLHIGSKPFPHYRDNSWIGSFDCWNGFKKKIR